MDQTPAVPSTRSNPPLEPPAQASPPAGEQSTITINPTARVLWRSSTSLQFELGTRQIVLDGIRPEEARLLLSRTGHEPPADPGDQDDPRLSLRLVRARRLLHSAGLTVSPESLARTPPAPRLAGELAALRIQHADSAGDVLTRRAGYVVVIDGPSQLAAGLAAVLAGAGVGHVHVTGDGRTRLSHCGLGGVGPDDEGRPYPDAAAQAIHRLAPEIRVEPPSSTQRIHLRILAGESLIDPDLSTMLHRARQAHLVVWSAGDRGVVGPLVVPGQSTCLRCTDLHRLDRDRGWSALAAQLSLTPPRAQPLNAALATTMMGVAGLQALAYLDGEPSPVAGATLEMLPPDWRLRRRTWPPHPDCDCGAFTARAHGEPLDESAREEPGRQTENTSDDARP